MKKKNDNILDKNLYDIAFNERDKEIKKIELMRKHVETDIEEAINQYVKAYFIRFSISIAVYLKMLLYLSRNCGCTFTNSFANVFE